MLSLPLIPEKLHNALFKLRRMNQGGIHLFQQAVVEHHDPIAQVGGQLENVGGENKDVFLFHIPQQVLHLQGRHGVEGGQRLVQQDHRRPADEKAQHLHLIFHAVGVAPHKPVPIIRLNPHQGQPVVGSAARAARVAGDFQKKFHKFIAGEKFRHHRGGQHVTHVPLAQRATGPAVVHQLYLTTVRRVLGGQTVEQGGLARAVSPQQAVDTLFGKGVAGPFQYLLRAKVFCNLFQYQFHE